MSDEALRAAYMRSVEARAPGERAACPAPEAILALVRREGTDDTRLSVLDHVMACRACRHEFELLRAIERGGEQAERAEGASTRANVDDTTSGRVVGHIRWRPWVPMVAAAALVLVIAVGPGRRLWNAGAGAARGSGEPLALVAPADGSTPSGATVPFVWRAAPGAERYTLELLTSGGAVALSRITADTTVAVALPAGLPPGDYRWWVAAAIGDGSVARSSMRTLRLRRR